MGLNNIISESELVSIISKAITSGTGKWHWLSKIENVPRTEGRLLVEDIVLSALNGAKIPIHGREKESDVIGFLSKWGIENGIKLYMASGKKLHATLDDREADILFQFIVLGEIAF